MNKFTIVAAGIALGAGLAACGGSQQPAGSTPPSSPSQSASQTPNSGSPTIGPSVPADGPFGVWWFNNNGNLGGRGQEDNRVNDLHAISQDENPADPSSVQADGNTLATDMQSAEANPPPYDAAGYQQAMADDIVAGNDYARGDLTAGDAEVQKANTEYSSWGLAVQPYCPNGNECVDQRALATPTPPAS
jgi:hypothetical protein